MSIRNSSHGFPQQFNSAQGWIRLAFGRYHSPFESEVRSIRADLAICLVHPDTYRNGQVETPHRSDHGQSNALRRKAFAQSRW